MELKNLLTAMEKRMPWREVAAKAIKLAGGSPKKGWRNTIKAAEDGDIKDIDIETLRRLYKDHLLVGEKFTKIYKLRKEECGELREKILELYVDKSADVVKSYPLPLEEGELEGMNDYPKPVEIIKNEDGVGAVYCASFTFSKREQIVVTEWVDEREDQLRILREFDELYGLKRETVQLFHVVWCPHDSNFVEIRVDYPQGMGEDYAHVVHSKMKNHVNSIYGRSVLNNPVDLFPTISSIYWDQAEGYIVEMGFTTITNSVKQEKMRRARNGVYCLREEIYHKAGSAALPQKIDPFRISVQWNRRLDTGSFISPEITLASTSKAVSGNRASISGFTLRNCLEAAQYFYARDRILYHVHASA